MFNFAGAHCLATRTQGKGTKTTTVPTWPSQQTMEASWGDVAMMLSPPYQPFRGSHRRAAGVAAWAAMAITEPNSIDSAASVDDRHPFDGDEST